MTPILRPLAIQPCRQPALDRLQLVCISCGEGPHVLALEAAGRGNRVFAWGRNGSGELGLPQDECAALSAPRVVDGGAACSNASPHPPWPCPSSARAPPQGGSERLWAALGGYGRLDITSERSRPAGWPASASGAQAASEVADSTAAGHPGGALARGVIISGGGRLRPLVGVSAGGRFSLAWGLGGAVGWGACAHGQLGQAAVSDVDMEDGEDGEDGVVQVLPRLLAPLSGGGGDETKEAGAGEGRESTVEDAAGEAEAVESW